MIRSLVCALALLVSAVAASVRSDDLDQLNKSLARLERFWSDQIRYQL